MTDTEKIKTLKEKYKGWKLFVDSRELLNKDDKPIDSGYYKAIKFIVDELKPLLEDEK